MPLYAALLRVRSVSSRGAQKEAVDDGCRSYPSHRELGSGLFRHA
jgi:hypothetical protein